MVTSNTLLLFLTLILISSAWDIRPLRAGTIQLRDKDIRKEKTLNKKIDLQMTKQYYEKWKDINVIASITSLNMDDKLNFYFDYNIICFETGCQLNFTFVRITQQVNPKFKYLITVDYLVARGLRITDLNFTSYQEHMMIKDLVTYNQNNQLENLVQIKPVNNKDALRILLIPNGWSNVTRTGGIVYLYAMGNQDYMYVAHYMEKKQVAGHDNSDSMGWPEGIDHVKYKVLYFDWNYAPAQDCLLQDKWDLENHYETVCKNGDKDLKWFYGFKRTKQFSIQGQFFETRSGYSFSLGKVPSRYGLVAFPFRSNQGFIDLRQHQYKYETEYQIVGKFLASSMLIIVMISLGMLLYKCTRKQDQGKRFREPEQMIKVSEGDITPKTDLTVETTPSILK